MVKSFLVVWAFLALLPACQRSHQSRNQEIKSTSENTNETSKSSEESKESKEKVTVTASATLAAMTSRTTGTKESSQEFIKRFRANPTLVMNELPPKYNARGEQLKKKNAFFSDVKISNLDFVLEKDQVRTQIMKNSPSVPQLATRAIVADDFYDMGGGLVSDRVENIVDLENKVIRTLPEMERANLKAVTLENGPWSDDYWAIRNGILGHRYADESVPFGGSWKDLLNFTQENTVELYRQSGKLDKLSPSEKYDLLIGDSQGGFTRSMWEEGRGYYESTGDVESWMGICHGWAPAAFMLPRPLHSVTLKTFDGRDNVTFYPSDIKALGSLLWARTSVPTKFIGRRCNQKDPKKDDKGRVLDQECFDNNPASWHMAVVNQIGLAKRSMVLDATYDYEVWNQPIVGYTYTYFNPETGVGTDKLEEAVIDRAAFTQDSFSSYRAAETVKVVGVEMTLKYISETSPSQDKSDSPEKDSTVEVVYRYDLELDHRGRIIGGEWYSSGHPDFLWVPFKGSRAQSQYDQRVSGKWSTFSKRMPKEWASMAKAAANRGLPLASVIEELFSRSQTHSFFGLFPLPFTSGSGSAVESGSEMSGVVEE